MPDNDVSLRVGVVDDTQQTMLQMIAAWKEDGDKLADALTKNIGTRLTEGRPCSFG